MQRKGNTLTKNDITKKLKGQTGSLKSAKKIVNTFFDAVSESIVQNDTVKIYGLGTFRCLEKRERAGRNPKNGDAKTISARRVVTFRPSSKLRDITMELDGDEGR